MYLTRSLAAVAGVALLTLLAGCSVLGGKAAEEPAHTVIVSDPPFEIREYPALAIASTMAFGDRDDAVDTGFGRLFRYISGANVGDTKIAMTAPVLMDRDRGEGQEIAMTAPVLTEADGAGWRTIFVLPEGMTAVSAPVPTDPEVTIGTIPPRRVAVYTFSGLMSGEKFAAGRQRLDDWLGGRSESPAGDWQMAGYNPPWTLPPLRRNEVIVPVE